MDLQQAKELQSSLMWASVVTELDKRIIYAVEKLKTCLPEDLSLLQWEISIYESLKRLPQDVIEREE